MLRTSSMTGLERDLLKRWPFLVLACDPFSFCLQRGEMKGGKYVPKGQACFLLQSHSPNTTGSASRDM